ALVGDAHGLPADRERDADLQVVRLRRIRGLRGPVDRRDRVLMRRAVPILLAILAGCASAVPVPTERELAAARRDDPQATLDSLRFGRERYVARCSGCHALHGPRELSPAEWRAELDEMGAKAKCAPDERRAIERYLVAVVCAPRQ